MDNVSSKTSKNVMFAALAGTVLVALCCFTPILVILLGAVGLSVFTPYLDFVLLPAFAMLLGLAFVSYGKWKKACKNCSIDPVD